MASNEDRAALGKAMIKVMAYFRKRLFDPLWNDDDEAEWDEAMAVARRLISLQSTTEGAEEHEGEEKAVRSEAGTTSVGVDELRKPGRMSDTDQRGSLRGNRTRPGRLSNHPEPDRSLVGRRHKP